MSSRLGSLLVRDGLIGVKRMERAFQRQVLFGGALDTVLLEMNELTEPRLLQYLSLASGLPPATSSELDFVEHAAAERCPRAVADQYGVVPVSIVGDTLRVLVRDPANLHGLEELASRLGIPVQPFVVPEYRYFVAHSRVFGGAADVRYVKLAGTVRSTVASQAVGRPQTVVIEDAAPREAVAPPVATPIAKPSAKPVAAPVAEPAPVAAPTPEPARAPVAPPAPVAAPAREAPPAPAAAPAPEAPPAPAGPTVEITARARTAPPEPDDDFAPLELGDARREIDAASHRDLVFNLLLRAVRSRVWYAGLLTIQGGAAIGRLALVGDEIDRHEIGQVLIPLDVPSAFKKVAASASPYIGPIASGDGAIDAMISRLGGVVPPAALLLPISLKQRVVALVIGHRGADNLGVAEVSDLLPLAGAAADALARIIRTGKAVGYRQAERDAVPSLVTDELPTGKVDLTDKGGWSAPAAPAPRVAGAAPSKLEHASLAPIAIASVLAGIESGDAADSDAAMAAALQRPGEVLVELGRRFPGRLVAARPTAGARTLRAAQHGPLLDLIVRLGVVAADLLEAKMTDLGPDVRYFATLCAAEIRPAGSIDLLVERLFDADAAIRALAVEGLHGYPSRELDIALMPVRESLGQPNLERARAAARALAEVADTVAIPDLIAVSVGPIAEQAQRALVALTKQDFGASPKKWRAWWDKNRDRHPIEWMLEGLAHKEPEVRRAAIGDLRRLTGEYFGYHHDLAKREREDARQRWLLWWHETGRRRFVRQTEGERHRPTAQLPPRKG